MSKETEMKFRTDSTFCKMLIVHHQKGLKVNYDNVIEFERRDIYDLFYTYSLKSNKKLDEFYAEVANYHEVWKPYLHELLIDIGEKFRLMIENRRRPHRRNRRYDERYISRISEYVRNKLI